MFAYKYMYLHKHVTLVASYQPLIYVKDTKNEGTEHGALENTRKYVFIFKHQMHYRK